MDIYTILKLGV